MRRFRTLAAVLFAATTVHLLPLWAVDSDPPWAEAQRLFEAGDYPKAVSLLNAALEKNSQVASLHYWFTRCFFELNDFERAVKSGERSIKLDPRNSEYHMWLGRAYGRKAEQGGLFSALAYVKKARHEFEEAVRLNPSNLDGQQDLIEFYWRAPRIVGGGDDKAQRQIEALAAVDPGEAHAARGNFLRDKKKREEAAAEFQKVFEARPKRVTPYLAIADFYQEGYNAAGLEKAIEAAARVDASDRRLGFYRGVLRVVARNRLEEGEQLLKAYLASAPQRSDFPSHASAREWLGRLYELQGNRVAAAEQYRTALKVDPGRRSAQEALRHLER